MIRDMTIARALPWLIAGALTLAAAMFSAGAAGGWFAHATWAKAGAAAAWKGQAYGLAEEWRAANDDLLARLEARDARLAEYHQSETRIDRVSNDAVREIEDAVHADRRPWGHERSVRLNRAFRALDAAAGPADGADGSP